MSKWTHLEAIWLCRLIEPVCPEFGCHVALTGGLLYKDGPRKDADLLFYRIRQVEEIDMEGLWGALKMIGLKRKEGSMKRWCQKATLEGKPIDCLFPDFDGPHTSGAR